MKNYVLSKRTNVGGNVGNLIIGVPILAVFAFVFVPLQQEKLVVIPLIVLVICMVLLLLKSWKILKEVQQRGNHLLSYATTHQLKYQASPSETDPSGDLINLDDCSIPMLSEDKVVRLENAVIGKDWTYSDMKYDIYTHTKNGRYKSGEALYAIMMFKLPRALPQVLFDSRQSNKMQYTYKYAGAQRHSLEGNFDEYFATYWPEDYNIDSLSFITPEVMQAMIDAAAYDMEIIDNHLYLYGPMMPPTEQIESMYKLGDMVRKKLLNNILTYRDERLPYAEGRSKVAREGMRLKRSRLPLVATIAFIIIWIIFQIAAEIWRTR